MIYAAAIDGNFPVAEPVQVARLRSGDPAALAETIAFYQHRLYRYFTRLVRDPAAADDLFQQTWLNVVRQLHRYDPARSFDTWLFAIAHNAAMDLLRRRPGERLEDHEFALPAVAPDAFRGTHKFNQHKQAQDLAATIEGQRGAGRQDIIEAIGALVGETGNG